MALLQISEPGLSPDPHQRRIAVGIDLGTTHSLVAAVRHGVAECLPDGAGRTLLPSAVRYLDDGARAIGAAALSAQTEDPHNTITSAKRLMGRTLADVPDHARLPYRFVDRPGMVAIETRAGVKTPVEVAAEILAVLRQRAEDSFGGDDIFGAVITVPAYFDDAQRQATKDAAQLAGINVLRLINEPTAAAVAYGLDNGSEGLYAVYDLGGGTFDLSLLRLSQGVFEVIATGGDVALGGDDIDAALADWVLAQSGRSADDARSRRALLTAARSAKEHLTSAQRTLLHASLADGALEFELTRAQLDAAARPVVERSLAAARRVLRDARIPKEQIAAQVHGVVLVGGATRMPLVRTLVGELFGRAPLVNLNPDEVVALGAARQAHQLAGNVADGILLLDVIPLSLGIETMGGLVERIIERNSTIPTAKAQDFTTFKDGQTAIAIHVVQGERELVADCRSLARFELRGIAPMAAGAARIRVSFQVDADGLLAVSAREASSGVEAKVSVKPSYGLADDDIARMLKEGFASAEADMRLRALREARVEAERMLLATRSALDADGDLLDGGERDAIDALQRRVAQAADADDAAAINDAVKALADGTEAFAALRMNRGIRQALAGRRVDEV